mmetsp:Transcript_71182/g.148861  ORF Transcript_71182/g.148861 Transcript_71182/m.148861 type:complete len:92 (-) Transcript_71182:59-334(-)
MLPPVSAGTEHRAADIPKNPTSRREFAPWVPALLAFFPLHTPHEYIFPPLQPSIPCSLQGLPLPCGERRMAQSLRTLQASTCRINALRRMK